MILYLLHMRSNVNRTVFNDRKNVSATALRVVTSPATISSPGMHDTRGRVVKMEHGENAIYFICWYYHLSWPYSQ